jgi:hypothetical protein
MIIGQRAIEFRTPARLTLVLCLVSSLGGARAHAEGAHPELGLAFSGFLSVGELAKLTSHGVGGDGALHVIQIYRGFGIRGALGYQRLQGHEMPTGEIIYNGIGTQEAVFRATQHFYWTAIGPEWRASVGSSHIDSYLMFGRADARADYSQAWLNTQGDFPPSTRASLVVAGATWISADAPIEVGLEVLLGGPATFWADPPVVVDGAGTHILQYSSASISGIALRVGYRLWYPRRHS